MLKVSKDWDLLNNIFYLLSDYGDHWISVQIYAGQHSIADWCSRWFLFILDLDVVVVNLPIETQGGQVVQHAEECKEFAQDSY